MELTAKQAGAELFPTSSAILRPGLSMFYRDYKEFHDIRTWISTRISQALGRFPYDLPSSTLSPIHLAILFSVSCLKLLRLSPVFHFLCQLSNAGFVKITGWEMHWISHRIIYFLTWWIGDSSSYQSAAVTYQAGLFFISWLTVYQGKYWRMQTRLIHLRRLIPRKFGVYNFFLS